MAEPETPWPHPPNLSTMALRDCPLGGILGLLISLRSKAGLFFFSLAAAASSGAAEGGSFSPFRAASGLKTRNRNTRRVKRWRRSGTGWVSTLGFQAKPLERDGEIPF